MRINKFTKHDLTPTLWPLSAQNVQKSQLSNAQIFGTKLVESAHTRRIRRFQIVQCFLTCPKLTRLLLFVLITLVVTTSCVTVKEDYYLASAPSSENDYLN